MKSINGHKTVPSYGGFERPFSMNEKQTSKHFNSYGEKIV